QIRPVECAPGLNCAACLCTPCLNLVLMPAMLHAVTVTRQTEWIDVLAAQCSDARQAQSHLATAKYPGAQGERGIEQRKRQQDMRKNAGNRDRHEHDWHEYPSVEDRGGDDLSAPGATTEQLQPTNDHYRQANHAK